MFVSLTSLSLSLIDVLYAICSVLLLGAACFIGARKPYYPERLWFAATALSLLAWTATLFLFNLIQEPTLLLWVGRINFAAIALAVYTGYRFVREAAELRPPANERLLLWETLLLTAITSLTPLIDQAELVGAGRDGSHITEFGILFPFYILHVLAYLAAMLRTAFSAWRRAADPIDDQLLLLGSGILATGAISLVTNVILPYGLSDFRWIDVGPLSTLLFLLAVAYAVVQHRLFDIRLFIRKTLVLGLVLSLSLAIYSAVVVLVTEFFASESAGTLTRFSVLVIAFLFDPMRRTLERKAERMLFPTRKAK